MSLLLWAVAASSPQLSQTYRSLPVTGISALCISCSRTVSPVLRVIDSLLIYLLLLQFLLGATSNTGSLGGGKFWKVGGSRQATCICFLPGWEGLSCSSHRFLFVLCPEVFTPLTRLSQIICWALRQDCGPQTVHLQHGMFSLLGSRVLGHPPLRTCPWASQIFNHTCVGISHGSTAHFEDYPQTPPWRFLVT